MAKPINWSKDGVIFINFLKPAVKWIRYAPGPTKIVVATAVLAVGITAYMGTKTRRTRNDQQA